MINVILDNRYFYCSFTAAEVQGLTNAQLWRKCQCQNGTDCLLGKGKFDCLIEAAKLLCNVLSFDKLNPNHKNERLSSNLSMLSSKDEYLQLSFKVGYNPITSALELILE